MKSNQHIHLWALLLMIIIVVALLQSLSNSLYTYNTSVLSLIPITFLMNHDLNISGFSMYDEMNDAVNDETIHEINHDEYIFNPNDISGFSVYDNDDNEDYEDIIDTLKHPHNLPHGVNNLGILDYGDKETANFATHAVKGREYLKAISSNPWYGTNNGRKPIEIPNPADPSGKTFLWSFSGDEWPHYWCYDEYTIELDPEEILEVVVDVLFDHKHKVKSIELLSAGLDELNKMISMSSEYKNHTPHIALMCSGKPSLSFNKKTLTAYWYCGWAANQKSNCTTTIKSVTNVFSGETAISFDDVPCIHIPYQTAGIVRSSIDNKFGRDYGIREFKDNLLENKDNECTKWGNYNHQLSSKPQSAMIKARKNAVLRPGLDTVDQLHRLNTKIWCVGQKFVDHDLSVLPATANPEYCQLGFVHDHNTNITAFNLYGEGMLQNLRLLKRFIIGIDDYSNNIKPTLKIKPNTTVLTIANPH
eukprot:13565_1